MLVLKAQGPKFNSSTHIKCEAWWCTLEILGLGRRRQGDPQGSVTNQSYLTGELQANKRTYLKVGSQSCLASKCTCMYVCTSTHVHIWTHIIMMHKVLWWSLIYFLTVYRVPYSGRWKLREHHYRGGSWERDICEQSASHREQVGKAHLATQT